MLWLPALPLGIFLWFTASAYSLGLMAVGLMLWIIWTILYHITKQYNHWAIRLLHYSLIICFTTELVIISSQVLWETRMAAFYLIEDYVYKDDCQYTDNFLHLAHYFVTGLAIGTLFYKAGEYIYKKFYIKSTS